MLDEIFLFGKFFRTPCTFIRGFNKSLMILGCRMTIFLGSTRFRFIRILASNEIVIIIDRRDTERCI